jgi:hypothetical protein
MRPDAPRETIKIEDIFGDRALLEHLAECETCRRIIARLNRERAIAQNLYERRN